MIGNVPNGLGNAGIFSTNFSYNILSGPFNQSEFLHTEYVQILDLGKNFFSGCIGNTFAYMSRLQRLVLQDNFLSGPIDEMFNFTLQQNLTSVDISANELTGTIPDVWYTHSKLSILLASTNCFHGSLSSIMCANTHLTILVLDGLHTAEYCRRLIVPGLHKTFRYLNAYMLTNPIQGSIPSCLFTLPNIQTLHLSGNAIGGSLPSNDDLAIMSPTLLDLSLSHNQLKGTIPSRLLEYPWEELDLSFNRLTGTISSNVYNFTHGTLKLEINQLSGEMPNSLIKAPSIDILQGNMFACPNGKDKQLPIHDINYDSYECGSSAVDASLYSSLVAIFVFLFFIMLMIISIKHSKLRESIRCIHCLYQFVRFLEIEVYLWWQVYNSKSSSQYYHQSIEHVYEFGIVMKEVRRWCLAISIVIIIILLPLYALLSIKYRTYWYTYAWQLSIAYMSGIIPAILILLIMLILLFGIYSILCNNLWINIYHLYQRSNNKIITTSTTLHETNHCDAQTNTNDTMITLGSYRFTIKRSYTRWYISMIIGGIINITVALLVNVNYIIALTRGLYTSDIQQTLSFLITMYRIIWNNTIMELLQNIIIKLLPNYNKNNELIIISFMISINLFYHIIIPCIAVAFVSPDCFYYALYPATTVKASFGFEECDGNVFPSYNSNSGTNSGSYYCEAEYKTAYVSNYKPPFTYNYQCTSSLLTNFGDVIIYRFVITGFITPILYIVFKYIHEEVFVRYGQDSYVYKLISSLLPNVLLALSDDAIRRRKEMKGLTETNEGSTPNPVHMRDNNGLPASNEHSQEIRENEEGVFHVQFKAKNAIIAFISDIAILLTFGGIFPPVAIIGILSIFSNTLLIQLILGRVIVLSRTQNRLYSSIKRINEKCNGIRILMIRSLLSLSFLLSIFWSFFLFDILGDAIGIERSIWILCVMATIPGIIQLSNYIIRRYNISFELFSENIVKDNKEDNNVNDIELAEIAS